MPAFNGREGGDGARRVPGPDGPILASYGQGHEKRELIHRGTGGENSEGRSAYPPRQRTSTG